MGLRAVEHDRRVDRPPNGTHRFKSRIGDLRLVLRRRSELSLGGMRTIPALVSRRGSGGVAVGRGRVRQRRSGRSEFCARASPRSGPERGVLAKLVEAGRSRRRVMGPREVVGWNQEGLVGTAGASGADRAARLERGAAGCGWGRRARGGRVRRSRALTGSKGRNGGDRWGGGPSRARGTDRRERVPRVRTALPGRPGPLARRGRRGNGRPRVVDANGVVSSGELDQRMQARHRYLPRQIVHLHRGGRPRLDGRRPPGAYVPQGGGPSLSSTQAGCTGERVWRLSRDAAPNHARSSPGDGRPSRALRRTCSRARLRSRSTDEVVRRTAQNGSGDRAPTER